MDGEFDVLLRTLVTALPVISVVPPVRLVILAVVTDIVPRLTELAERLVTVILAAVTAPAFR